MKQQENTNNLETLPKGLHILAKPIGPKCNLDCQYCFYLEKEAMFQGSENFKMPDKVLEAYTKKYIRTNPSPEVEFVWQGGEPTLMGLDFFKKVIKFQMPYIGEKKILNSLQTNGTLLNDDWCKFLAQHGFLVGLSLDGPENIHNKYRKNKKGEGSFADTLRALKLLQKHNVEHIIMACVAKEHTKHPLEIYNFFKEQGVKTIQFSPVVEREADENNKKFGLSLASPSSKNVKITDWSVNPKEYGNFLIKIVDEWIQKDFGNIFIMNFEWALHNYIGNPSPVCTFAKSCGRALAMEYNGDIFSCDHSVFPDYKLGNILKDNPHNLADKNQENGFGINKTKNISTHCQKCDILELCNGGCPNHRFEKDNLNYLCQGYKKFFKHIEPYLLKISKELQVGRINGNK
ncbi:MAG: anaerobic sulfatase maturase [Elusimicrobiaceae bacterium]|nr:anaerobic sulfatase maturase [Elusimicrobiaceae bacterium]MBT4439684.1 anaerobic sulfatase maturase [Elusimicrobiaceae bacterium]